MTNSNVITLNKPEQNDPLQEVLREGARKMLTAAIEAEIAIFIEQHSALQTDECWRRLKIDHLEGFVPIEF